MGVIRMNKKHEEIAKIIKNYCGSDPCFPDNFVLELADYFERESKEIAKDKHNPDNINEFNRKDFLKMCGV